MFELCLQCPQDRVEEMADALQALGAQSISVEDADALTDAESALFGEPGMPPPQMGWRRSRITALFSTLDDAQSAARLLGDAEMLEGCSAPAITLLADQDWVRLTQSQFAPVAITPTFWIVPSWHEAPAQAQQIIRLDPGLAFGTGTHPTTRMCLRWTAAQAPALAEGWTRVLDYGCGSGILAIGAALHGARGVDAVDIDEAAVTATGDNALANGVTLSAGLPQSASGAYPLVLANILATPLKLLAPLLAAHVAPGGHLVLAGILERQADELKAAYAPWLSLQVSDQDEGWILMTARRPD